MTLKAEQAQQSFNDLVNSMKGRDTLSSWDVLVSYDEVQINALLAHRAEALGLHQPLSWPKVDIDPITEEERTYIFDVTLLKPTLQFVDTSNSVIITCGLAGNFHLEGSTKTKDLPSGLVCEISTSLVNIAGEWHAEDGWIPSTTTEDKPGNDWVTVLEPNSNVARGVCIDFTKCKAALKDAGNTGGSGLAHLNPLICAFLEEHFASVCGLRYCLAAVSNHFDPNDDNSQVLQPSHFCFTLTPGVLMMWIGLRGGSASGTRQSGQTTLTFAPDSQAVSPIPEGHTASIIFSQAMMMNLFLRPSFSASPLIDKDWGVKSTSEKGSAGLSFDFKFLSHETIVPKVSYTGWGGDSKYLDGTTIDLNENKTSFTIDGDRPTQGHWPVSLSWSSNEKGLTWSETAASVEGKGTYSWGKCNITFSYHGTGQWQASSDPINHPNQLGLVFSFDKNFQATAVCEEAGFWEWIWGGKRESMPVEYGKLQPAAPSFDLVLKPLDYFLTTNLLFPGEHVFHADDPAPASTEVQSGLAMPRDTILTGNLMRNETLHSASLAAIDEHRTLLGQTLLSSSSAQPTLDKLKEAFLSFPTHNILGDIFITVSSASEDDDTPIPDLLQKHGFGNLDGADFFNLWGTSWRELIKTDDFVPLPDDDNLVSSQPQKVIDLRLFGGCYTIVQPARDRGEQFVVHPTLGSIRMGRKDFTPQQLYDAASGKVTISWKTETEQTYAARFELVWDAERLELGMHCFGTVRGNDNAAPEPFEAYLRGFLPQEEVRLNDKTPLEQASMYMTMIVGGVGILNMFATCYLNSRNASADNLLKKRIKTLQTSLKKTKEGIGKIKQEVKRQVAQNVRRLYRQNERLVEDAAQKGNRMIKEEVEARLQELVETHPNFIEKLQDPSFKEEISKDLAERGKHKLEAQYPAIIMRLVNAIINKTARQDHLYNGITTDMEKHDISIEIGNAESSHIIDIVDRNPEEGEEPLSEVVAMEVLAQKEANEAERQMVELVHRGEQIDLGMKQISGEIVAEKKRVEEAEEALKNETDPKQRQDLQEKLSERQHELLEKYKKLQEAVEKRGEVKQELKKREEYSRHQKKESEEARKKREKVHERFYK